MLVFVFLIFNHYFLLQISKKILFFFIFNKKSIRFNSRRMGELIHGYLTFLLDKLHLHQRYPFLSPDLNAEKIKKKELTSEIR